MKNLLALLAAALVTFVVVGWYLNWYQIHTTPNSKGGTEVTIDLNNAKIKEDLKKGEEKIKKILDNKTGTSAPTAPQSMQSAKLPETLPPVQVPPVPTQPTGFQAQESEFQFVLPGSVPVPPPPSSNSKPGGIPFSSN